MDYRKTVQLPKTDFPMRGNLPKREPEMIKRWQENKYYEKLQEMRKDAETFILHDGPPYANGNIHLGTALNKVLKDMVVRSRSMDGYRAPYVPGWDTHGLPIELAAVRSLGVDRDKTSVSELREKCRQFAHKWIDVQREEFIRLGVWGDWNDPYLTLKPEYEAKQIEIFGKMATNGHIYKGRKPVYWCMDCETALAEAEIEYGDHHSPSIYVRFPVQDGQRKVAEDGHTYFLIWTTTPWTIPANLAITLHPRFIYVAVAVGDNTYIVARDLLEAVSGELGWEDYQVQAEWSGAELEGIKARHPLIERESVIILGEHVTLDAGTGCVHTAPGHGLEDYIVGQKYGLPIFNPVDSKGRFTAEGGKYEGKLVTDANEEIVADLKAAGHLLEVSEVEHQYPYCWRCKNPVIFRATEQWFASVDGFREEALRAIKDVQWIPAWGIDRITNMVADRTDWCISRQRVWGVPIPIFYCQGCGKHLVNEETIKAVAELFRREGSNAWFEKEAAEILPAGTTCPECGGTEFTKETDTMDVWFDSGSSHAAVLQQRPELRWPADLYLEGSDQHRGWFQSSLLTSVAAFGKPPYKAVLTHGFTVDAEGRKMSKSVGNVIAPKEIVDKYGADILRLWTASSDYRGDIRVSQDILKQMAEVYRRIRNTIRFVLGNLHDFDPRTDMVSDSELSEMDRWALLRLNKLKQRVIDAYRNYEFHVLYHAIHNFCAVDMGGFYLDVLKDLLYCAAPEDPKRRAAQTAMYRILMELTKLLAPVLVFTAEEAWQHLPKRANEPESVHLTTWTPVEEQYLDPKLEAKWDSVLAVRREVMKALEAARSEKAIGSSNDAAVDLYPAAEYKEVLQELEDELPALFIVSAVRLHVDGEAPASAAGDEEVARVVVSRTPGEKCPRCWRYYEKVTESGLCERCQEVVQNHYQLQD